MWGDCSYVWDLQEELTLAVAEIERLSGRVKELEDELLAYRAGNAPGVGNLRPNLDDTVR